MVGDTGTAPFQIKSFISWCFLKINNIINSLDPPFPVLAHELLSCLIPVLTAAQRGLHGASLSGYGFLESLSTGGSCSMTSF